MTLVIKRDGNLSPFDNTKIEQAIMKAMKYGSGIISEPTAKLIALEATNKFGNELTVSIKDIEEFVFERLVHHGHEMTARAYEGYRAVQAFKRENFNNELIDSVIGLIQLTNEEVMSENANKNAELVSTQRDLIAGEVSKIIAKNYMIPPHIVQANEMGAIKIHE